MTKLKIVLVFISIFVLRWITIPSPLPEGWQDDMVIRYSMTVLENPEFTDTQTIVRTGRWYIPVKGYIKIIPGSHISFVGKIEPKWNLGKVTQIKMIDPVAEVLCRYPICVGEQDIGLFGELIIVLGKWRDGWIEVLERSLPEPMASLAAGILLGVKGQMPRDFYDALINTGTLHIVAASGYNVSIVATIVMRVIGGFVSRNVAIVLGILAIVSYAVIAGGSAAVVRAGFMASLTLIAYYFGRPVEARRLLWVVAAIMLNLDPLLIFDIGFQLSFAATAGLLYIEPLVESRFENIRSKLAWVQAFLAEYLYPTLAATIATLPVILYHFGRVSLVSPLVNMLILPVVPWIMGMTAGILFGGQIVAWLTYPLLAYVVYMIKLFG